MNKTQEKMQQEVFKGRPVLAEILESYGKYSLADYVERVWQTLSQPPDQIFIKILQTQAEEIYGVETAKALAGQILKNPLVSTISHHGISNHPIFVNSDLIYSLHFKPGKFAPVLSTESVSLNNTSSWSGSLLHHTGLGSDRHSFFRTG